MNKNQRTTLHTLSVLALAALMGACTSAPSQPAAPMPPTIAQHSTPDLASYDWNLTAAFDRTVEPLLSQIRANLHQSRTLATLRDTLLPKLLSGELAIQQPQKELP